MAINESSNIIVNNMNYTPNSDAVNKANGAVNNDDSAPDRVSSDNRSNLLSVNSNALSVLKGIEKHQAATRINNAQQLQKITDMLGSSGSDAPLRNSFQGITEVIDNIKELKLSDANTETKEDDKILNELYDLNAKSDKIANNITSGFNNSVDEAKKLSELETKVKEIRDKRKEYEDKTRAAKARAVAGEVASNIGEASGKAIEEAAKNYGMLMGDDDQKLMTALMGGVKAFQGAVKGYKAVAGTFSKGMKWFKKKKKGEGELGEEGSTAEEKALAIYNEQLEALKASNEHLRGLGVNLENEETYQKLMASLTENIEEDLTLILKAFNNGVATGEDTSEDLVKAMEDVTNAVILIGGDDVRGSIRPPSDVLGDLKDVEDLVPTVKGNTESVDKLKEALETADNTIKLNTLTQHRANESRVIGVNSGRASAGDGKGGKLGELGKALKSFKVVKTAIDMVMKLVNGIRLIGTVFSVVGAMFSSIYVIIGLVIALIIGAIVVFWDDIKEMVGEWMEWINSALSEFGSAWDEFWGDDPLKPIQEAWDGFMNWIKQIFNDTVNSIKEKLPSWFGGNKDKKEDKVKEDEGGWFSNMFSDDEKINAEQAKVDAAVAGRAPGEGTVVAPVTNNNNTSNVAGTGSGGGTMRTYSGLPGSNLVGGVLLAGD